MDEVTLVTVEDGNGSQSHNHNCGGAFLSDLTSRKSWHAKATFSRLSSFGSPTMRVESSLCLTRSDFVKVISFLS